MNMMVSATAIAAAAPAAQALGASPDQELVDLAKQIMDRLPEHRAASKRLAALWEQYNAREPARSDVLMWRLGDDVGYDKERLTNGKCRLWCDPFDIASLRGVRQFDWFLPEHNEAEFFSLPEDDQLRHRGAPKSHVQQLFSKEPSTRKQNRINKLIAALDEHTAACDALKAELGIHEVDALVETLWDPIAAAAHRMQEIEPVSILGLQAKAQMLLYWYWEGSDLDDEDPIAVEIIKGLATAQLAA
jgi:hypothetical protein